MTYEFLKKTLGVVVLYNEKINDSITLNSLEQGLDDGNVLDLIVYDNSNISQDTNNSKFRKFNIQYVHNSDNPGVSLAYNYGAEQAQKLNKDWLLILDQDTHFASDYFRKMDEAVKNYKHIKLFAPILKISNGLILSPFSFRFFYGRHLNHPMPGVNSLFKNQPVNSGILVNIGTFIKAGGYNNKVKLDYSDHQFIERVKPIVNNYYVISSIGQQDFSGMERDLQKILLRFKFYCNGAFNFETHRLYHRFLLHFFLGLKVIKNSFKYKTLGFFKVYYSQAFNSHNG